GLDKGYNRFQRLFSLLEIHGAGMSNEYANKKFLKSLPSARSNISLIMRNKPGIDNLDIDDIYNNLKVYDVDIKGSSGSSSNSQNAQDSSSYTDELMFSFLANQSSSSQLNNEDLKQIDQDDLEEMDLKWQVAIVFMRVKRFYKKTRRKLKFNGKEPVGFDKTKVEFFNCRIRGHFARDYRAVRNLGNMSRDAENARYRGRDNGKRPVRKKDENALVVKDGLGTYDWSYLVEEEATEFALMAFTSNPSSSSSLNFEDTDSDNDSVFRPTYIPAKIDFLKADRMAKKSMLPNNVGKRTGHKESRPVWKNVQRINHQNKFTPTIVFTRSGRIPVSDVKPKAAASTSAAKPVNTVGPKQSVNFSKSRSTFHKSHSPIGRSFYNATTHSRRNSTERGNTIGSKAVSSIKGNRVTAVKISAGCVWRPRGHPRQAIKNKGIVNSWCSRYMTGNKAYLADYQEINDGGFVAFGSSR
nr:hypothetical protein [Tanacetum cinerariifolium]